MDSAILQSRMTDKFVELARTRSGRLFRKQILRFGEFIHPNDAEDKLVVNKEMAEKLVANFNAGVCDIVQVPIVGDDNKHSEDPNRNVGEVVDLAVEDDGVYATIDVRDEDAAKRLGKTLLGASAMMHLDYMDAKSGKKVGPTLLHAAITNRPYITGLEDFREVIAASADLSDDPVFLTQQEEEMNLEQLKKLLKDEHKIDLDELLAAKKDPPKDPTAELSGKLTKALADAGLIKLSGDPKDEVKLDDVTEAISELAGNNESLGKQIHELQLSAATAEVDALVKEGRVLPKQKNAMVKLAMEDRKAFEELVPEKPMVALSAEQGVETHEELDSDKLDSEIERLVEFANTNRSGHKAAEK